MSFNTGKPKSVAPTKKTSEKMLDYTAEQTELLKAMKAEAEKVFKALGEKCNVKYDLDTYTNAEGKDGMRATVQFNCYDNKVTEKDKDGKDTRIPQTVTLTYGDVKDEAGNTTGKGFTYVSVSTFKSQKFEKVDYKNEYESVHQARIALENAGLVKPFATVQKTSDRTYSPEETLRYKASVAVKELNEKLPKVSVTKDGVTKEVNSLYVSELKDTSFKTKNTNEEVKQTTFRISNHDRQFIDINMRDGGVASVDFIDAKDYNTETKKGNIDKRPAYNQDYLDKRKTELVKAGLDKNLVDVLDKLDIKFIERAEKTQDTPEINPEELDEMPFEQEI